MNMGLSFMPVMPQLASLLKGSEYLSDRIQRNTALDQGIHSFWRKCNDGHMTLDPVVSALHHIMVKLKIDRNLELFDSHNFKICPQKFDPLVYTYLFPVIQTLI